MAKSSSTPMSRQAASRIAGATAKTHGGKIPAKSFASVADQVVQQREAGARTSVGHRKPN